MTGKIQKIDMLIKNAKVFNNGETAVIEDVAITAGRIISRGQLTIMAVTMMTMMTMMAVTMI